MHPGESSGPHAPGRNDWSDCLTGSRAEELRETLRGLGLAALQVYPTPKTAGLPLGHELRILRGYLSGGSTVLYESAFSGAYRSLASRRTRRLFDGFVLNRPLAESIWSGLLGRESTRWWLEEGLFDTEVDGSLSCRFQAVPIEGLLLLTDSPRNAHNLESGQNAVSYVERPMHEYLCAQLKEHRSRALDVGPGAGLLTIDLARTHAEAEGVDLNPRAAVVAGFNVRLNEVDNCRITHGDIFDETPDRGVFDTISWNSPFIFLPEELKDSVLLAYGGHMGIEITLRFFERLPALMAEDGVAHVASAAPLLENGDNFLIRELTNCCSELKLDVTYHQQGTIAAPSEFDELYRKHAIARFEGVFLEVRRGTGRVTVVRRSLVAAAVDQLRRLTFS